VKNFTNYTLKGISVLLSRSPEDFYADWATLRQRREPERYMTYPVDYDREDDARVMGVYRPDKKRINIKKGEWM
jgi:hypothetical protein